VAGVDALLRRAWVEEMGSWSAIPIASSENRLAAFKSHYGTDLPFWQGDLTDYELVEKIFRALRPDAVVHFGECPSAPYSMIDRSHATWVQKNNLLSSLNILFAIRDISPETHLVKLGTMGEYGTPNVDIPEGFFNLEFRGRKDYLPFPRKAGSWYHWSKVHGSNNIMFACELYNLRATDIMQGVVYGTRIANSWADERLCTRLDFDQAFGTAINRFCCQAVIGHPLTPYGKGKQTRGFLPLKDSMQCLTLALENPPTAGEYRVFNQLEDIYAVRDVAKAVQRVGNRLGLSVAIQAMENPRREKEEHYYRVDHQHLLDLGYKPTRDMDTEIQDMLEDLLPHRERIMAKKEMIVPDVTWEGTRRRRAYLEAAAAADD